MPVPKGCARVSGSEHKPLSGAKRVADADPTEVLSVTIRVRRRTDGLPLLSLEELAKIPLHRRQFAAREEFAARYGASPDDLGAVAAFAEAHGLKVTGRSAGQRTVSVTCSVKDVQAAFGVKLQRYEAPAEVYRGHEGFVHVPQELRRHRRERTRPRQPSGRPDAYSWNRRRNDAGQECRAAG